MSRRTSSGPWAWLVELAPGRSGASAGGRGRAVQRPPPGLPLAAALTDNLRGGKHLLLILDNCEHLVDACARLCSRFVAGLPPTDPSCQQPRGLGIAGETTFHVPTLGLPEDQDTTAAPSAAMTRPTCSVARLRRLGPISPSPTAMRPPWPDRAAAGRHSLAIELAAARVRLLAPEQIAARLDDRFRLLTGGSRTALPRQQTLHALVDWSHDLLSTGEATLFRRLGVFAGGLDAGGGRGRDEWRGVAAGEVLDLLSGLINKSLVVVDESEGQTRYHFWRPSGSMRAKSCWRRAKTPRFMIVTRLIMKVLAGESRLVFENGVAALPQRSG